MAHLSVRRRSLDDNRPVMSNTEQCPEYDTKGNRQLCLVLCGSDATLKNATSKRLRGKKKFFQSLHKKGKDCVKKDEKISGRLLSVVELPALSGLSEDEVMHQTLLSVTLCHPGVHAFIIIVPVGPLTDEDKAEIEMIHRRFGSGINQHDMILITQEKSVTRQINFESPSATDTSIQTCGGRQFVLKNSSQVPDLLQYVENMVRENRGSLYTIFMFLHAQIELERNKHKSKIEELEKKGVTADGVRIVLLGKTGVGKSASGNTILRKQAFKSLLAPQSVTRECLKETSEFNRRQITVIDTPGLFDTGVDNDEIRKEIVKCISMAAPGPHVFLLVIQLGRFTQEEKDAVKMIQDTFGDKSRMYTMVLFTKGDELGETTIEQFVEVDDTLQNIINQCGKRYHVFNNKNSKDRKQVSELLDKIDCMVTANGGSFYTNEMFEQVEKNIREEQERIMKEKEEEIKRREEELRARYEAEIEQMKKEHEKERLEMQNDLKKTVEDFQNKEEEIKKEKDENLQKELQRKLEEQQKQFEEMNKWKENMLAEQQQNFIKYLEERHEKEKEKLKEQTERETRKQAEREYLTKVDKEVANALKEAEEKLPCSAKRARDWSHHGPVGAAAGGFVGYYQDVIIRIASRSKSNSKSKLAI